MTVTLLHPEELLDRERRGELASADARALDEHCADCAACRLQRNLWRQDAAGDLEAQASAGRAAELALARLVAPGSHRPVLRAPRRAAALAAVVLVGFIGSAAAATWLAWRAADRPSVAPATPPPTAAAGIQRPRAAPELPQPAERPPAPEPVRERSRASAATLFAQANRLRRQGAASEAVRIYGELQQRFPAAEEALISRVVLGRLLLDRRGEPLRALRQFEAYLQHSGQSALREEAMIGRAVALGRLGRAAEERRAWQALLAAFPDSMYSEKARLRLSELEPSP